jgi:hypothetical protein
MNRGLGVALLVATACGAGQGLAASGSGNDGGGIAGSVSAGAWDATVGFGGGYRAGCWTPIVISPHESERAAVGDMVAIWAEDPDGQFVRSPPVPLSMNAAGRLSGRVTVRIGRPTGQVRIEHVAADGRSTITEVRLPEPLASTRDVVFVGGELPAVRRAVRLLPRGDEPPPAILEPVSISSSMSSPLSLSAGIAAAAQARDYDSLDTIMLCGSILSGTAASRLPADDAADILTGIDAWVRQGGRLILAAGASAEALTQEGGPAAGWLPGPIERLVPLRRLSAIETFARSSGLGRQPDAATLRVPLLANRSQLTGTIEAFDGGAATDLPLVVRRSYGLGTITWVGLDLDAEPFRSWPATDMLVVRLFGGRIAAADVVRGGEPFADTATLTSQLRRALETLPAADGTPRTRPVPFELIIGLGLLYVLSLYPLDWWLAGRAQQRGLGGWLPWLSLPALVVLFTASAWAVADRWRPLSATAGEGIVGAGVDVVDVDAESGLARGRSWAVVWSPRNAVIDVALRPRPLIPAAEAPDVPAHAAVSWFADTGTGFAGIDAVVPHPTLAATDYRYADTLAMLADVPLAAASNRLFEAGWTEQGSGGVVTAALSRDAQAALDGEVAHHLPFPLTDCRLAHGGWVYEIGRLAPGEIFRPRASRGPRSLSGLLTRRGAVGDRDLASRWDPTTTDLRRILDVGGWHTAAGGTGYTGSAAGPLGRLDLSPLLGDRAILTGYGPVDGGPEGGPLPWQVTAGQETPPVTAAARLYRIVIPLSPSSANPADSEP